MSFSGRMREAKALEAEMMRLVEQIKSEIIADVKAQPFHGKMLNDGSNGGPVTAVIPFSEMARTKNFLPEYHIPAEQGKAVCRKLDSCKTVQQVMKSVREMLESGTVRLSSNERFYLNENTLKILRESEIGQYIAEEDAAEETEVTDNAELVL